MTPAELLADGLLRLGAELPAEVGPRLLEYLALLEKWNATYNLTAIRDPLQMVTQHLLDSLTLLPHVGAAQRLIDVGSGAGLPGIPLAIARPDMRVTLLDSNQKKAAFLRQAKVDLGLANVGVVAHRVEEYRPAQGYDVVVARAFSDLPDFTRLARHLCGEGGVMLAMKGLYPYEELARLPAAEATHAVLPLDVPHLQASRHLVLVRPS